jgi:hypothetical protein
VPLNGIRVAGGAELVFWVSGNLEKRMPGALLGLLTGREQSHMRLDTEVQKEMAREMRKARRLRTPDIDYHYCDVIRLRMGSIVSRPGKHPFKQTLSQLVGGKVIVGVNKVAQPDLSEFFASRIRGFDKAVRVDEEAITRVE